MRERPDGVVLDGFFADAGGDGIRIDPVGVLKFGGFGGEKNVQSFDEVHRISQVVAGLEAAEGILLGHEKADDEREQLFFRVQFCGVGEIARKEFLRLVQKFAMPRTSSGR